MKFAALQCVALLLAAVIIRAADFQDAKDAARLASPDLVDQEEMSKFLKNLHQEHIFEGVSEQSKSRLHASLPSLKSDAQQLAEKEEKNKHHYASLVAQLESLHDQMETLDANVHEATVKVAAADKLVADSHDADLQIERLRTMLESENSRRARLASTVSALQHSELLVSGHVARALRSSEANIAPGSAESSIVEDTARLVDAGVGARAAEIDARLQQLGAKLDARIAELDAKKPSGRWRLADDSTNTDALDD
jgi:predicted RNase H-like nuclease (RuvC/YqgF family)